MAHVIRVRPAQVSDAGLIVRLVRALAAYEKESPETVRITEADVIRDGFGETPRFEALIAEMDGVAVGFALFFANYSTWEGLPGLYVEDLFVEERARRHDIGRRLMAAVARIARERGFGRIDLAVLNWNPARGFYRRLGLRHMESWELFRLEGGALENLAVQSDADGGNAEHDES